MLAAHFPKATVGSDQLLLRYRTSIWNHPATLSQAQRRLAATTVLRSVTRALGPGAGAISPTTLASLHRTLGPPNQVPVRPPTSSRAPASLYRAYRQTSQFISPDGRTVQYYAVLRAGPVGSPAAAAAIPNARATLTAVAHSGGAIASGIAGQDASAHDINQASTTSLQIVVPVVLALILILLALLLRSLVAPWYLALTVGLSYLAALGFAMIVFVHLGGQGGLIFVLPLLMFVFSMALGEDYNILIMSRIREETRRQQSFAAAVTHAIGITGGTITSAGIILAGTFAVLGIAGGSSEAQQLGYSIAFGVLLDTFFVRSLLIPSIAMLLGPLNWWPSTLARAGAAPATSKTASGQMSAAPTRHTVSAARPATPPGTSMATRRKSTNPPAPSVSQSANERIDDDTKQLLAAILDFTSMQRHHEASERPSLGIGRALQQHRLAARHTSALLTVALHGPMTITQLAQRQRIKLKAASLTAVELEQAGLLERREDRADRRRTIVAIPKSKERAVNHGLLNRANHLRRTLDRLTPQQRDGLIIGLNTLIEELAKGDG